MEYLIGLYVTDDKMYTQYREAMFPLLQNYGGGFGYDFKIAQVLKSEAKEPINRVFTIYFKDEQAKNDFFSNEEYLTIKKHYFEKSVSSVIEIAKYKR
jgi:uncharacterized protein (DUF1330 family)